jgi:hypothetical protein
MYFPSAHYSLRQIVNSLAVTCAAASPQDRRRNVVSDVVLARIVMLPAAALFGARLHELSKLLSWRGSWE